LSQKKFAFGNIRTGVNKVIYLLTLCDIFVWGPWFVATPVLALFLSSKFGVNTVEYIGLGTAFYYLARGLLQMPIGALTDRIKHDHDEIFILGLGCILMASPFLFIHWVNEPWQYLVLQAVGGAGASMDLNTWRKLFAKNLETKHTGYGYGFYEAIMSLATAGFAFLSGYLSNINNQMFELILTLVGVFMVFGSFIAISILLVKKRGSWQS
jgi:MFS family permease